MGGRGAGGSGGGGGPLPPPSPPPQPPTPRPPEPPTPPEPKEPKEPIGPKPAYLLSGVELRPLILEIGEQEEKEIAKINEQIEIIHTARLNVEQRIRSLVNDELFYLTPGTKEYMEMEAKITIERKIRDDLTLKRIEAEDKKKEIEKEHRARQHQLFYVKPGEGIEIDLTIGKGTKLYKEGWKNWLKPQKEFLEKVIVGGGAKVEFKVKGRKGSGGESSDLMREVEIGVDFVGTTPLHEYIHQVEHQLGLETTRSRKFKEYVEKKTGKKLEDIEMKELSYYTESSGKEHTYGYGSWVPKIFKTPKEENDYGYMFRFYTTQTEERGGKRYAKGEAKSTYRGGDFAGTEFLTKAFEHIYKDPAKFAKEYPEIFDIAFDVFRGK